ncbi:hypothetical protein F090043F1_05820 [Parabacteroides goldsteinii]
MFDKKRLNKLIIAKITELSDICKQLLISVLQQTEFCKDSGSFLRGYEDSGDRSKI